MRVRWNDGARILREERWDVVLERVEDGISSQPLIMQRVGQNFVPDEALGKGLLRAGRDYILLGPVSHGLGNCVEGPLLNCLDLFVVRGIRCTSLTQDVSTNTGLEFRY